MSWQDEFTRAAIRVTVKHGFQVAEADLNRIWPREVTKTPRANFLGTLDYEKSTVTDTTWDEFAGTDDFDTKVYGMQVRAVTYSGAVTYWRYRSTMGSTLELILKEG